MILLRLQVEHIVIHAFASGSQTSTFRVTKLSEEFKAAAEVARQQGSMGRKASLFDAKRKQTMKMEAPKKKKEFEPADEPGITKLEFRRRMLKQRVREWFAFLETKPDLTWVSEEDAAALAWAYSHKGDFKLKTNPGIKDPLIPVPELRREEMPEIREIVTQEDRDEYEAKIAAAVAAASAAESKPMSG